MTRKNKFGTGYDSNKMLFRKMCYNFFLRGKIVTTHERAKALKSLIDTLVSKTGDSKQSNKNYILRYVQDKKIIKDLFEQVGPKAKSINGGYVSIKRLHLRTNDGAQMAQLAWAHGLSLQKPDIEKKTADKKTENKSAVNEEKKTKKEDTKKVEKNETTDKEKSKAEDTNSQEK